MTATHDDTAALVRRSTFPSRAGTNGLRVALVVAALAAAVAPLPAGATPTSQAVCLAHFPITASPGVSLSPARFAYTSHGQTGAIDCVGQIQGQAVTGQGTIGDEGVADASCTSGSISGVLSMTIPTATGPLNLRVPVRATFAGGVGLRPSGEFERGQFPGGFVFVITQGDCAVTPATEAEVVVHGILST